MTDLSKSFEIDSIKAASPSERQGLWTVYETYEVSYESGETVIRVPEGTPKKRRYAPLDKYPDLFLRFGRCLPFSDWARNPTGETQAALDWARQYGLPGTESRGGRWERVSTFAQESGHARTVLELYEAAMDPYGSDLGLTEALQRYGMLYDPKARYLDLFQKGRLSLNTPPEKLVEVARAVVLDFVNGRTGSGCGIILRSGDSSANHASLSRQWRFDSLLRAMYLQMLWLIESPERAHRCAAHDCQNILTVSDPDPNSDNYFNGKRGKYRTRKDRKYCSGRCSQRMRDQEKRATLKDETK